jgi:transcriptional regulator with XRE-family HTH domain
MASSRKSFHPIDTHVGKRLRLRRKMLSLSQTALGEAIGLTFQQIQKYERGANRIGASRLYELSEVLDVPVSYFFDDLPPGIVENSRSETSGLGAQPVIDDPLLEPVSVDVIRAYTRIENAQTRKSMFNLAKALARETGPDNQKKPRGRRSA